MWKYYNPLDQLIWYGFVAVVFVGAAIWWNIGNWLDNHPTVSTLITVGIVIVFWVLPICAGIIKIVSKAREPKRPFTETSRKKKEFALLKSDALLETYLPSFQKLEKYLATIGPMPEVGEVILRTDDALTFALDRQDEVDVLNSTDDIYDGEWWYNDIVREFEGVFVTFSHCWEKLADEHPELLLSKHKDSIRFIFNVLWGFAHYDENNTDRKIYKDFDNDYHKWIDFSLYYDDMYDKIKRRPKDQEYTIKDYTKILSYIRELGIMGEAIMECKKAVISLVSMQVDKNGNLSYWKG